ncbi:MAG: phosphonate C-P lyase system protein PhnH [Pseudomonadota bacterium]
MHAVPLPSDAETRHNATFDALMWALSRPGLVRELPAPGPEPIAEALLDRECAVWCADPALATYTAQLGVARVPLPEADHVFLTELAPQTLAQLRCGSDLYPDDGATLVCPAVLGTGPRLRFTGPGCDGVVEVKIDGVSPEIWAERTRLSRYPMGFEMILVDGAGILGIPRSTHVEVL